MVINSMYVAVIYKRHSDRFPNAVSLEQYTWLGALFCTCTLFSVCVRCEEEGSNNSFAFAQWICKNNWFYYCKQRSVLLVPVSYHLLFCSTVLPTLQSFIGSNNIHHVTSTNIQIDAYILILVMIISSFQYWKLDALQVVCLTVRLCVTGSFASRPIFFCLIYASMYWTRFRRFLSQLFSGLRFSSYFCPA